MARESVWPTSLKCLLCVLLRRSLPILGLDLKSNEENDNNQKDFDCYIVQGIEY